MRVLNQNELDLISGGTLSAGLQTTLTDVLAGLDKGVSEILTGANSAVDSLVGGLTSGLGTIADYTLTGLNATTSSVTSLLGEVLPV